MGKMRKPKPARRSAPPPKARAYDLEVCILSGQMTDSFVKKNRSICRTIRIRGDETLERLHEAIFDAFERFDQHMYEFQVGGKGPMDPRARRYVLPMALEVDLDDRPAGVVTTTTL